MGPLLGAGTASATIFVSPTFKLPGAAGGAGAGVGTLAQPQQISDNVTTALMKKFLVTLDDGFSLRGFYTYGIYRVFWLVNFKRLDKIFGSDPNASDLENRHNSSCHYFSNPIVTRA